MNKRQKLLYYIYCALGEKSHPNCDETADKVAMIRLIITAQILITNFFIIFGVIMNTTSIIREWNSNEVSSTLYASTEKENYSSNRR